MAGEFTHLHLHTEYSLLDGAARIKDVIARAAELNMKSIAITDHGVMYGVIDFYREAIKNGIKPIIGCEMYICADRFEKTFAAKDYAHLILLAKDYEGYVNLMKLVSAGFTEGYYYKPRIDYELLAENAKGLVCTSACIAGDIPRRLLMGDAEGAKAFARRLKGIFGEDFYIEIMDHGLAEQKMVNPMLIKLARELNIELVATNDVHFTRIEDSYAQDILVCISTVSKITDENRMSYGDQLYLKSREEMEELFPNVSDALDNTQKIADKCNLEIEFGKMHLPVYEVPEGLAQFDYLMELSLKGLTERYGKIEGEVESRFKYEIETINSMGFTNYFLIVWDFVNYAKKNGIRVGPGRGSAAGSIVAYALEITDIDPIKHKLLFERFLNPERVSMPDIDIDFCYERRQEVIDYVSAKYGSDRVAQIITFGTLGARLVLRDVARVLDISVAEADRIAKMVPFELKMTIDKAIAGNPRLKAEYENNEKAREIIDVSRRLEGMPRHASTHAAGVVIADGPIASYVPLQRNPKDGSVMTQYTMEKLESIGLLKMDFLGLRTLTVIRDAVRMAKEDTGADIDIDHLDMDDKKVYAMIAAGDTDGVFQLESGGMRRLMQDLAPDNIDEIMVGISLFRPGPMDFIPEYIKCKRSPSEVKYAHPMLESILGDTYGCMVYQEQVMQMVRDIAGYSMGRSDLVRRAMSKKKADVLQKERDIFINGEKKDGKVTVEGAIARGVSKDVANRLFDQMMDFANYAFNKSHACAYAYVAYQTAYLKYYYPVEFWTALLNSYISSNDKLSSYIQNLRLSGIKILPPDVNASQMKFTVEEGAVRFGFAAISYVGEAIDGVVENRAEGKYRDFYDFISRNAALLNKKRVESLILSGAFDSFGAKRSQLMAIYESVLTEALARAKRQAAGQTSFFDTEDGFGALDIKLPEIEEFSERQKLKYEKEMTGIYISGHPLREYFDVISAYKDTIEEIAASTEDEASLFDYDGKQVCVMGIITELKTRLTKSKALMANIGVEDIRARIGVLAFPNVYSLCEGKIGADSIVRVAGKVSVNQSKQAEIIAESITPFFEDDAEYAGKRLYVRVNSAQKARLSALIEKYPGKHAVIAFISDKNKTFKIGGARSAAYCAALIGELRAAFGEGNVVMKQV